MEKEKGDTVTEAAPWRYLIEGLSMQGRCINENCQAYNQEVLVKIGMGSWKNVYEFPIKCPMCGYSVNGPWEPWFHECEYRITIKYEDLDDKKTKKHRGDVKNGRFHNYEIEKDCLVKKCKVKCWPLESEEPNKKQKPEMHMKKEENKEMNNIQNELRKEAKELKHEAKEEMGELAKEKTKDLKPIQRKVEKETSLCSCSIF